MHQVSRLCISLITAVLLETLQILIYASKQCDPTLQLDTVAWMVVRRQYISQNLQESGVTGDAVLCLVLSLLTSSMDDRAAHEMSQIREWRASVD